MAPSINAAAKNLQANRPRPTAVKSVVPALPIQYVQKRKQATAKKVEDPVVRKTQLETTAQSASLETETTLPSTNGGFDENKESTLQEAEQPASAAAPATPPVISEDIVTEPVEAPVQEPAKESVAAIQNEVAAEGPHDLTGSAQSDHASSGSRSTYQMPPPFYPASHGPPNPQESVKFLTQATFNGYHPMHNTHPSTGSLVFGGYTESNNSSPAPPPSAGNLPPYPYQQGSLGGRSQAPHMNGSHHQNLSNGFSPMGPPPGGYYPRPDNFMMPNSSNDSFARRQMVSFAPPDGYSPSGTPVIGTEGPRFAPSFDPSTPHSFQGSQSSAPNDQEPSGPSFYNQYAAPGVLNTNGFNGHVDEVQLYQQQRSKPRSATQNLAPPPSNFPVMNQPPLPPPGMDNYDGLLSYLQSQFGDPNMADYTLEVRYSDDRAPPLRIPGHNLMFARSPTLKGLMTAQVQVGGTTDSMSVRNLLIEVDDRFLRSDAFWMAAQRLYGGPLLDVGVLGGMNPASISETSQNMPGSFKDRFDLALGYAAAGHLLQLNSVLNRGIEIASHFINWLTIERALEFSLEGGLDSQWTLDVNKAPDGRCPSKYGPSVNLLIHTAMNFIITSFPPDFDLDTTVGDLFGVPRLPTVPAEHSSTQTSRLSFIKFGDHPTTEDNTRSTSDNSTNIILSRVLLSLPFQLLKYVLESQHLGNVNAWATTALRQKVMHTVIEEREKRRQRVYGSSNVSTAERTANGKQWEVVGWQENVVPYVGGEVPSLKRTWVDFTIPGRGA
ncbi:hypothetical protein PVAG01_03708 [Phlyctema vagabunda]|uniref:Uncharacterized protein n=1 Tax=Phlyctema vagabunda TaxID=108571 RepID=A0ABR4PM63_9HELO